MCKPMGSAGDAARQCGGTHLPQIRCAAHGALNLLRPQMAAARKLQMPEYAMMRS
jgi:hypothetical protein